jgi:hypothetical protein
MQITNKVIDLSKLGDFPLFNSNLLETGDTGGKAAYQVFELESE